MTLYVQMLRCQTHQCLHHFVQRSTGPFNDRLEVRQRLERLLLDFRAFDGHSILVHRYATGDEDEISSFDRLRVRGVRDGCIWSIV